VIERISRMAPDATGAPAALHLIGTAATAVWAFDLSWGFLTPIRAARESLDALAFDGLAEIARRELRASGESSIRRTPDARDNLTPQELQIVRMAAEGKSNREIGRQLFISHRTVAYHLYRVFPKLGITSRSQLHSAMLGLTDK
jgi:DNA-binding NarL/FixJ family response regulator